MILNGRDWLRRVDRSQRLDVPQVDPRATHTRQERSVVGRLALPDEVLAAGRPDTPGHGCGRRISHAGTKPGTARTTAPTNETSASACATTFHVGRSTSPAPTTRYQYGTPAPATTPERPRCGPAPAGSTHAVRCPPASPATPRPGPASARHSPPTLRDAPTSHATPRTPRRESADSPTDRTRCPTARRSPGR